MIRLFTLVFSICLLAFTSATYSQEPPDNLEGQAMKNWLKANYYNGKFSSLGYSDARKKMYAFIDNVNGTIKCVYSGYTQDWPAGLQETNRPPINTEHSIPQSFFGEDEPMRSDLHHLYPTYGAWNTLRSAWPYAEIVDTDTEEWIRNETSQSQIPSNATKDEWSEYKFGAFEPREDHKGDLARSIFYFYTMYSGYDITRVADVETLCEWHKMDPVSQKEKDRNQGIQAYQGNLNPFISYPNVAANVYGCEAVSTGIYKNALANKIDAMIVVPKGSDNEITVRVVSKYVGDAAVEIYSTEGKKLFANNVQLNDGINEYNMTLNSDLSKGIYIASLVFENHVESRPFLLGQ